VRTGSGIRLWFGRSHHVHRAARFGFRREDLRDNLQTAEVALGFRPNRFQLVKVGYLWLRGQDAEGSEYDVLGIQYVTSFQAVSKAFR
jgi:hypothetical protein